MSHYWIKWMTAFGLSINDDFPWEKWVDRFACIWKSWVNFEIMLRSLIEYGKCTGNAGQLWTIIFPLISGITGEIIGNDISQYEIVRPHSSIWTLCWLSQTQQPGQCYMLIVPRRMIQPSGILEGSCYICSAAVNCGLEKCISSECFSNVLIKVSPCRAPSLLSPPHFQE